MNSLQRVANLVVLLSVLAVLSSACGDGNGPPPDQTQRLNVSCPAGQVPWDFARFPTGATSESLAQLGGALDGGRTVNQMNVLAARCTSPARDLPDVLSHTRNACNFQQSCFTDDDARWALVNSIQTSGQCAPYNVVIDYTCSDAPEFTLTKAPYPAKCVQRTPSTPVTCVPENCYGRTRRDATLQCVPDFIKPIESRGTMKVTITSLKQKLEYAQGGLYRQLTASPSLTVPQKGGDWVLTLLEDEIHQLKGTVEVQDAKAPRQAVTLWLSSKVPVPGSTVPTLDIFRCSLGKFDLSKYTPEAVDGGVQRVTFDEEVRFPPTCFDGRQLQDAIRAAYLANNLDATKVPDSGYEWNTKLKMGDTVLRASYDLDGAAIVTPANTTLENTCNIKPIDFFFNHKTRVHNAYDYYAQAMVDVKHRVNGGLIPTPWVASSWSTTVSAVTELSVRGLEFKVNKAGRARGAIAADVTAAIAGPLQAQWSALLNRRKFVFAGDPYTVTPFLYLGANDESFAKDRGESGIYPVPNPMVKDANGNPVIDTTAKIPLPDESLRLSFTSPVGEAGTTVPYHVPITSKLRTALFGGKYPLIPGGDPRNYVLQVCSTNKVMVDILYLRNPYGVRTLQMLTHDGEQTDLGGRMVPALNNCARSAVFSIRGENVVTPIEEPEIGDDMTDLAPTTSGESRMAATFDSDTTRECEGTRCETKVAQELAGTSAPIKTTMFAVESEDEEDGIKTEFSTDFKILGFNVLKTAETGQVSEAKTTLTISPNYEAIAKVFKKPSPSIKVEPSRVSKGINGLSVGLEYKVPIRYGPIQGDLIFGVGAGVGLNMEVAHEYNGKVESSCIQVTNLADGGVSQAMDCTEPYIPVPATSLLVARNLCNYSGGKLAEPRTDEVVNNMRAAIPSTEEVWVGAQVGHEYVNNTDCAVTWNSNVCKTGHNIYMRWLSDTENFQKSTSFAPFVAAGAPYTLNNMPVGADSVLLQAPVPSGVTLKGNQFRARPLTDSYRAVCVRPPAGTSGQSHKVSMALNLGFSAGFSVAFCSPSDEAGVCIEGSVNVLEAKLTPAVSFTHTQLKNTLGASASSSILGLEVGWSVALLSGAIEVKLVSPFFSIGYTLIEFEGFKIGEGKLVEWERIFQKDYQ